MSTTLGDLINSIASSLHSYTGVQENTTYLTSDVASDALTLPVASSDQVMRGIAEVDDELVYVDVVDNNNLTIMPFGRGYRGTTAAVHSANTQVISDPSFPRAEIRKAVDQAVLALYPTLFQIKNTTLTYTPMPVGYALPTDVDRILDVKVMRAFDPVNYWQPVYEWSFDPESGEASGKALNVFDFLPPGSTLRVTYQAAFAPFAALTDTLTSVGLKDDWTDLIIYVVTSRMVRFLDPARLQLPAVENASRSQYVAVGDAGKVANQLYAMYQQRLAEERKKLLTLVPSRINFQR